MELREGENKGYAYNTHTHTHTHTHTLSLSLSLSLSPVEQISKYIENKGTSTWLAPSGEPQPF